MATTAITGRGAVVSFATSTFTAKIKEIKLPNLTKEKVDCTDLSIADGSSEKYLPGDNHAVSEIEIDYFFNPTLALLKPTATTENITVTPRKMLAASAAAGTFVASGFVSANELPSLARNTAAVGKLKFQPDGDASQCTWTPEA